MSLKDKAELVNDQLNTLEMLGESKAEEKYSGETRTSRALQAATILSVVTVGIVAIIGILIYSEVKSALPAPTDTQLNEASGNVTDGYAQAMELVPVVLIVMVAALVIAVVQRFRG